MTKEKIDKMAKDAAEWVSSEEGRAAIEEAARKAEETIEDLREARKISWWKLFEPYGGAL